MTGSPGSQPTACPSTGCATPPSPGSNATSVTASPAPTPPYRHHRPSHHHLHQSRRRHTTPSMTCVGCPSRAAARCQPDTPPQTSCRLGSRPTSATATLTCTRSTWSTPHTCAVHCSSLAVPTPAGPASPDALPVSSARPGLRWPITSHMCRAQAAASSQTWSPRIRRRRQEALDRRLRPLNRRTRRDRAQSAAA